MAYTTPLAGAVTRTQDVTTPLQLSLATTRVKLPTAVPVYTTSSVSMALPAVEIYIEFGARRFSREESTPGTKNKGRPGQGLD